MTKSAQGNILHYTFKSREIYPLFDRQWHKLGISVQSGIISLYLDCNLIERKQTDEKFTIDFQGRTLIASRAADDKPVDVSSMKEKLRNSSGVLSILLLKQLWWIMCVGGWKDSNQVINFQWEFLIYSP